jgi:uncharacterized protein
LAKPFLFEVVLVSSYSHVVKEQYNAKWVHVDCGKEAVDLYIANRIKKGDILVSQDIGLLSLVLPKGVHVITPRGITYDNENISTALEFRYLHGKERRSGTFRKGPKKFSYEDLQTFCRQFLQLIQKLSIHHNTNHIGGALRGENTRREN